MSYPKDSTISSIVSEYDNVPGSRTLFDPTCELHHNNGKLSRKKSNYEQRKKQTSFKNSKKFRFPIEEEIENSEEKAKIAEDFYVQNNSSQGTTLDHRGPQSDGKPS